MQSHVKSLEEQEIFDRLHNDQRAGYSNKESSHPTFKSKHADNINPNRTIVTLICRSNFLQSSYALDSPANSVVCHRLKHLIA